MLKDEIQIGGVYRLRWHDGTTTEVEILGEKRITTRSRRYPHKMVGTKKRYVGRNLRTNRLVEIKSAAKLRERVS